MQLFLLRENGKGRGLGLDWSTRPSQLFVLQRPRLQPQPHLHLPVAPMPAGDNFHLNNGIRKLLSGRHLLQQLLIPQIITRRFFLTYSFLKEIASALDLAGLPSLHTHMRKTRWRNTKPAPKPNPPVSNALSLPPRQWQWRCVPAQLRP